MNKDKALSLMAAATFIATRPDEEYYSVSMYGSDCTIESYITDQQDWDSDSQEYITTATAAEAMATIRKSIGGTWDKNGGDYNFTLSREIAPNVIVKLVSSRDAVCTPKVIGTETVEVKDYENCPKKMETRDIVEWDCNPILESAQTGE